MSESRKPQERCAWKKCRRKFTPTTSNQKHCTRRCGTDAWNAMPKAERVARRATKHERHPKARLIYEAKSEAAPGECPWGCERQLPPGCRTCCRDRECLRAYQRAYRIGRYQVERETRSPLRTQACKCGCGGSFTTRRKPGKHLYLPGHKPKVRRKRATFSAVVTKYRSAT